MCGMNKIFIGMTRTRPFESTEHGRTRYKKRINNKKSTILISINADAFSNTNNGIAYLALPQFIFSSIVTAKGDSNAAMSSFVTLSEPHENK